jgi:hypothetical protein
MEALSTRLATLQDRLHPRLQANETYNQVLALTAEVARARTGLYPDARNADQIEPEVRHLETEVDQLVAQLLPQSPRSADRQEAPHSAAGSGPASPRSGGSRSPEPQADGMVGPPDLPEQNDANDDSIPGTPVILANRVEDRSLSDLFANPPGAGDGGGGGPVLRGRPVLGGRPPSRSVDSPPSSGLASANSSPSGTPRSRAASGSAHPGSAPDSVPGTPRVRRSVSPVEDRLSKAIRLANDLRRRHPESEPEIAELREILVGQIWDRHNAEHRSQSGPAISSSASSSSESPSSSSSGSSSSSSSGSSSSS